MKIPHVVHIIPTLSLAGAERFVVSLCTHIDSSKLRQSVVTLWDTAPLAGALPESVELHSFHIDTIPKHRRIRALAALLQRIDADIVHTHLFSADLWGRLAARRIDVPVVTTEHNINTAEPIHWRLIKRAMKGYSNIYTAPSEAVVTYMQEQYGIDTERVALIPHGIDTSQFAQVLPPTFDTPKKILVLGRLVEQKGHRVFLDALAQLTSDDYAVTIVGSGPLEAVLKKYAKQRGVAENITWQPAVTDVTAVYAASDIVVVPSLWEGFGLVALEAMASGRVVIAADTGGLRDLVQHGKTGWVYPAGDAAALSTQLALALSMTVEECGTMGEIARTWATTHGDIATMADRYLQIYRTLRSDII